jgi:hypothetical protein
MRPLLAQQSGLSYRGITSNIACILQIMNRLLDYYSVGIDTGFNGKRMRSRK